MQMRKVSGLKKSRRSSKLQVFLDSILLLKASIFWTPFFVKNLKISRLYTRYFYLVKKSDNAANTYS